MRVLHRSIDDLKGFYSLFIGGMIPFCFHKYKYGKNAVPLMEFGEYPFFVKICVATIGTVHFSVCAISIVHTFLFLEELV